MEWLKGKNTESKKWIAQLGNPAKRNQATNELLRLGPTAVDSLIEALTAKDANLRTLAEQLIVRMGATAIPRLSQLLDSAHPTTRQLVADILGRDSPPRRAPRSDRSRAWTVFHRPSARRLRPREDRRLRKPSRC